MWSERIFMQKRFFFSNLSILFLPVMICDYIADSGQPKLKGQIRISNGTVEIRNFRLKQ